MNSRRFLVAALAALNLARPALAAPDTFGIGDGHTGPLSVSSGAQIINSYAALAASAGAGAKVLSVSSSAGFVAGDLVMVWQASGTTVALTSGSPSTVDLSNDSAGRYELGRVASVAAGSITLVDSLTSAYQVGKSQVIRMPEYTTVTVAASSSLSAKPWDGSTGGMLAFLATSTVTVDGSLDTHGQGFRGGLAVTASDNSSGCADLDGTTSINLARWAEKGESVAGPDYFGAATNGVGRGNLANGGGGGDCYRAGGAGGGNGGAGGSGGKTATTDGSGRVAGGLGGAPLTASLYDHLLMGGGGGAGQGNGGTASSGAAGGGVVFLRAASFAGLGGINASGASAINSTTDGAGGGGAGGSVYLRTTGSVTCLTGLAARGGNGGSDTGLATTGPGGGGGGGQMLLQTSSLLNVCVSDASSGTAGLAGLALNWGAAPLVSLVNGVVGTVSGALSIPTVPTVTSPTAAAELQTLRPTITGTAALGVTVQVYDNGVYAGSVLTGLDGSFSFTPVTNWTAGSHVVQVSALVLALESNRSVPLTFSLDVTAPAAPSVLTPLDGSIYLQVALTATGACEAGSLVNVYMDDAIVGSTTCSQLGLWTLNSSTIPGVGVHTLKANATDGANNVSAYGNTNLFSVLGLPLDGGLDAGLPVLDAGLPVLDAGSPTLDGGDSDGGEGPGNHDGGISQNDAGTRTDAGTSTPIVSNGDAGVTIGASDVEFRGGGGCSASLGGPDGLALALLALVTVARRLRGA